MKTLRCTIIPVLLLFVLNSCTKAPAGKDLPRSTPEAQGVSSDSILRFLDAVTASPNELHSFVLLRHGQVIAEGWWDPYRHDLKHTLYSTSKSFTATAVGFAVSEKKLAVSDKVISFFPESLPDTVSDFLAELSVKDLLTMSAGQEPDPTHLIVSSDSNWVKKFLYLPIVNKPGSKFLYNSMASYMLSAIVQKVTGEKVLDYLRPRLFEPLGIEGMDWETDPKGINTGGWGLRLKTEDMARFGQLFLQKGMWNGKQILPASWVEEASTAHIDQAPDATAEMRKSSDWMQGYCYQMWRCRNNAFRADGAFGQYIIIMPDQDAVIAITSETPDMQNVLNLVWTYIQPSMQKEALAENKEANEMLQQRLHSLCLPATPGESNASLSETLNGKNILIEANELSISMVSFVFTTDSALMKITRDNQNFEFPMGNGRWLHATTSMKGPNLLLGAIGHFKGIPDVETANAFQWKDNQSLSITLRYIESPHHLNMLFIFDKDKVKIEVRNSQDFGKKTFEMKGMIVP